MHNVKTISRRRMEDRAFIVAAVEGERCRFGSNFDERRGPIVVDGYTIIIGGEGWDDGDIGCTRDGGFESRLFEDEH
jgi:hypothetical protein